MWMLPDDVIERILLGVPAFDLVRCKAVCKVWRSLISSADFVAAHLHRAKSDPSKLHLLARNRLFDLRGPVSGTTSDFLICFSSEDRMFDIPQPVLAAAAQTNFFRFGDLLIVVGSANGLICIAGKGEITPTPTPSPDDIWILNPVTRLSRKLPYSGIRFGSDQNIKFAFWCDDGVYKLAKFLSNPNALTTLELWVSTSPDSWAVISTFQFHFHDLLHRFHAADVIIEGLAAYWVCDHDSCYENPDHFQTNDGIIILSLNLKTLALNKFIPPWYLENNGYIWNPRNGYVANSIAFGGKLNGEFVLVAYKVTGDGHYYDVWTPVMDNTGAVINWIKKHTISLKYFPFDHCLGIVNDKIVLTIRSKMLIVLCDPSTGIWQVLETTNSILSSIKKYFIHGFVGSLVSIGFESGLNPMSTMMMMSR